MSKGELVGIEGKLRLDKYTNENGEKRSKIRVKVDDFTLSLQVKEKKLIVLLVVKISLTEEIFDKKYQKVKFHFNI